MDPAADHALGSPFVLTGPSVAGSVPGPRSAEVLARQAARESAGRSYPRRLAVALRRGQGALVEDLDGNVYIDCLTGAGVLPLGHGHPAVVAAVKRQLDLLATGLDLPTEVKDEFIEAQLSILPDGMRSRLRFQFCGASGADAMDAALKLCKTATGRAGVIAFHGAFHGMSHSSMALTGLVAPKAPIGNLMPGVQFFPYPYCYRCPIGLEPDSCEVRCLTYLEHMLRDPYGGVPLPAAVVVEAVQGEGGVIPASPAFLRGLRELTASLDVPLVVDEIQTGYGRTGTWFAFEAAGIAPDVVLLSKAAGGVGMPIAFLVYDEKLDHWAPGAHSGTFRGNQLAFAAGVAAIAVMREDGVLDNVAVQGCHALDRLSTFAHGLPEVGDVRGVGLMIGVELVDPGTGAPDGALARRVQADALGHGLMLEAGGRHDAVIRLLPPLNIDRGTLDVALDILTGALARQARLPRQEPEPQR